MDTKKSAISTIFFDIGDTLYVNAELEMQYPAALYTLLSESKQISVERAKELLKQTTETLKKSESHVTKVRAMEELGYSREEVHKAFATVRPQDFLSPDVRLQTMLNNLSQKYTLGIISNFKKNHVLQILQALGLSEETFTYFLTEDIVKEIKPALEPFEKAIQLAGVPAKNCLYIGDSPTKDMAPAKKTGMTTLLVNDSPSSEDLVAADGYINTIYSLPAALEKLNQ